MGTGAHAPYRPIMRLMACWCAISAGSTWPRGGARSQRRRARVARRANDESFLPQCGTAVRSSSAALRPRPVTEPRPVTRYWETPSYPVCIPVKRHGRKFLHRAAPPARPARLRCRSRHGLVLLHVPKKHSRKSRRCRWYAAHSWQQTQGLFGEERRRWYHAHSTKY